MSCAEAGTALASALRMPLEASASPAATRAHPTRAFPRRRPEDTALHRALRENLETFLSRAEQRGRSVPRFVVRELRAYLNRGDWNATEKRVRELWSEWTARGG